MNSIIVSVIIPCYNQGKYLAEALDSVKKQKYKEWECIIVDDGSTDDSKDIAISFCQKDQRFRYIYQENQGLAAARNRGIINSTGKYILPLDGDDIIHEDYLLLAYEVLDRSNNVKVVYCRAEFFGNMAGEWILPEYSLERMAIQNCIFCSAMFRREDYDKTIGFNTNMKYGLEDWDFWISLLENGGEVYKLPMILFYYRKHSEHSMLSSLITNENVRLIAMNQLVMNHPKFFRSQHILLYKKYEVITTSRLWGVFQRIIKVEKCVEKNARYISNAICDLRVKVGGLRIKIVNSSFSYIRKFAKVD